MKLICKPHNIPFTESLNVMGITKRQTGPENGMENGMENGTDNGKVILNPY